MRKVIISVLTFVISFMMLTTVAFAAEENSLVFELNEDGTSYAITDCDTTATGEIIIPDTYNNLPVTVIKKEAFSDCEELEKISMPNSITNIETFAFLGCTKLKSINFSQNIKTIGKDVFLCCYNLEQFLMNDNANQSAIHKKGESYYFVKDSVLFLHETNGQNTLLKYPNAKQNEIYVIPQNTTTLASESFVSLLHTQTIVIPSSVVNYSTSSFQDGNPVSNTQLLTLIFQHDSSPEFSQASIERIQYGSVIHVKNAEVKAEFEAQNDETEFIYRVLVPIEVVENPTTDLTLNQEVEIKLTINTEIVIEAEQNPITSSDNVTFTSSNVNVASFDVNGCGVLTAKAPGTTTLTITSGSVSKNVAVTVICNHENTETIEAKAATCTEDGNTAGVRCLDCGQITGYEKTNALGHDTQFTTRLKPTCTRDGSGNHICTRCDKTISTESIPKLGHSTEWITVVEATCSADGQEAEYCSRCDRTLDYRNIPKTNNHTFTAWITVKEPTCVQQGIQHRTCTQCSKVETTTNPATGNHTYSDWTIDTQPTCTTNGSKSRHCTVCDYCSDVTTINALGHKTSLINIKNATCTENGYTGDTYCSTCNQTISKGTATAKLNHKVVTLNAVAPTCTKTGLTQGSKCSVCNTILTAQQTIAASGHKTITINAKNATCTENGYTGDTKCSICGLTLTKGTVTPKLVLTVPTVTISNTFNGIKVTWNAIENAESYIVYRRQYNAKTKKWSGWSKIETGYTTTNYVDSTVKLGTNYRYTVRAVNGNAMSKYTSTATLKFNVKPTVKIANAKSGVTVKWSKVVSATGYTVYRSQYVNGKWSSWKNMGTTKAKTSSWTDKKVKSGVAYKYTVRAVNGSYKSSYKASNTTVFLTQPTVKAAKASNGIKVTWSKVTGVTGYKVYRSQYVNGKWSSWKNMGTTKAKTSSWTDKTATTGVTYRYTVRAVYGNYMSSYAASNNVKK